MLYKSSYTDLQVLIRAPVVNYHPVTGVEIGRVKPLRANFGTHGGEFSAANPLTGEIDTHAIINGNFFDTNAAAEQLQWTEDEKESVEAALDKLARTQPYLLAKIDLTRPPAAPPWPTYDETASEEIVPFAISLGFVDGALAYERENLNRPFVTAALEDAVAIRQASAAEEKPAVGSITL